MEEKVRASLEQSVKANKQREEARVEAKRVTDEERENFEAGWAQSRLSVVEPAMIEIADWLKQNGWVAEVKSDGNTGMRLEVYTGDMRTAGGVYPRPSIIFQSGTTANVIYAQIVTTTSSMSITPGGHMALKEVNKETVQELCSEFFDRLSKEK